MDYEAIINDAIYILETSDDTDVIGLEPTKVLIQAATDHGIELGEQMNKFLDFANKELF